MEQILINSLVIFCLMVAAFGVLAWGGQGDAGGSEYHKACGGTGFCLKFDQQSGELVERFQGILDAHREHDQQLCCGGQDCGCQGATVFQEIMHFFQKDLLQLQSTKAENAEMRAALKWFVDRQSPIQSKFNLYGPEDTAQAMIGAYRAAEKALANAKGEG